MNQKGSINKWNFCLHRNQNQSYGLHFRLPPPSLPPRSTSQDWCSMATSGRRPIRSWPSRTLSPGFDPQSSDSPCPVEWITGKRRTHSGQRRRQPRATVSLPRVRYKVLSLKRPSRVVLNSLFKGSKKI